MSQQLHLRRMAKENSCSDMDSVSSSSDSEQPLRVRRILTRLSPGSTVSILDSGCDVSVFGRGWLVEKDLNEIVYCKGPFLSSDPSDEVACRLVNAVSIFEFPGTSLQPILVQLNRGLASEDPGQFESLVSTSQLMHHGVAVDMVPSVYP